MSVSDNEVAVRRWIDAWNVQDPEAAGNLLSPDFVRHDANVPEVVGAAAQQEFLRGVFSAFPDIQIEIQQLVAQGDTVAARLLVRGTHRDEFLGIPATGRGIKVQSTETYRLADGKIIEEWVVMDALGLMQQLGAIPGPTPV
jgi:C-1 hydroxylase